jgi:hypothetical protein
MNQQSSKVAMDNLPFIDKFIYISIKSSIDRGLFYCLWLPIVFLGSAQLTADFLHSWWPPDFIDSWYAGAGAVFQHRYESWLLWNMMKHLGYLQISWFMMHVIMFHYTSCAFLWAIQSDDQCLLCVYCVSRESQNRQRVGPHQLLGRLQAGPAMLWVFMSPQVAEATIHLRDHRWTSRSPFWNIAHHFAEPHDSKFKHIFPHDYSLVSPSIWGWVKTLSPWWTSNLLVNGCSSP